MANTQRSSTNTSLVFNVARQAPELIAPARPTPYEFKELSDIDDQDGLRFQVPVIQFYRNEEKHTGGSPLRWRDPCRVIKEAVAKALVPYYPLAGRLREKQERKLVVECNGEGVMFIEADANVTLEEFGDALQPPFPCLEELLYNVPGSTDILDTPLILIQVTRLECGGFILAYRANHTMTDAPGLVQFMKAAAELACGAETPSIQPVWDRHLLCARNPPEVTCEHHEYEKIADTEVTTIPLDDMVYKTFFFGPTEIAALRRYIPTHLKSSTYEIIMACIWRCRTIALQCDPEEVVRLMLIVNIRTRPFNPPLPKGYYGNAFAFPAAVSTASKLCGNPIGYALALVKKIKADVTQEYMKSLADFLVLKGRPCFTLNRIFIVSDVSRAGFGDMDFGWGPPTYGGPAESWVNNMPGVLSFYTPFKTKEGEEGVAVPMCLPSHNMKIFIKELNGLLSDTPNATLIPPNRSSFISSSL